MRWAQNESAPVPAVGTGALNFRLSAASQSLLMPRISNQFHWVPVWQQQQHAHIVPRPATAGSTAGRMLE